jgi:hypothetical protein
MLLNVIVFVLACAGTALVASLIGKKRRRQREKRQAELRDALLQWAYAYRQGTNRKPVKYSAEDKLLKAVYKIGTSNLLNHDKW